MKKLLPNFRDARDHTLAEQGAIVLPAIMWWLGVPLSLLVVLWLVGMV
jgi:hypothetical protein